MLPNSDASVEDWNKMLLLTAYSIVHQDNSGLKWNDNRQLSMQQKLMEMQEAANRRQADYTQNLNKDMWDYTNYENQVKHLEAAGLNPALL